MLHVSPSSWNGVLSAKSQYDASGSGGSMEEVSAAVSASSYAHKWYNIVRQQITELEGPRYQYKAMFCEDFCKQVFQFILYVQHSNVAAQNLVQTLELEEQRRTSSFLNAIKTFLMSVPMEPEEYSLEERMRVPMYLKTSLSHLCDIFQIERSKLADMTYTGGNLSLQNSFSQNGFHEYTLEMCNLHESKGVLGFISRQVLKPPRVTHYYNKSPGKHPKHVDLVLPLD